MTVKQAAEELGVSERHVRKLIDAERLPAMRLGSMWVIRKKDVKNFRRRPVGRPVKVKVDPAEPWSFATFLFHPRKHRDATKELYDFLQSRPLLRLDEYNQVNLKRLLGHLKQVDGLHLREQAERAWERWNLYKADYCRRKRISPAQFDELADAKRIVNLAHVYHGPERTLE